ncbi:MAG: hypothetical protein ACRCZK_04920, partial [Oscillospiraceae bacterium]
VIKNEKPAKITNDDEDSENDAEIEDIFEGDAVAEDVEELEDLLAEIEANIDEAVIKNEKPAKITNDDEDSENDAEIEDIFEDDAVAEDVEELEDLLAEIEVNIDEVVIKNEKLEKITNDAEDSEDSEDDAEIEDVFEGDAVAEDVDEFEDLLAEIEVNIDEVVIKNDVEDKEIEVSQVVTDILSEIDLSSIDITTKANKDANVKVKKSDKIKNKFKQSIDFKNSEIDTLDKTDVIIKKEKKPLQDVDIMNSIALIKAESKQIVQEVLRENVYNKVDEDIEVILAKHRNDETKDNISDDETKEIDIVNEKYEENITTNEENLSINKKNINIDDCNEKDVKNKRENKSKKEQISKNKEKVSNNSIEEFEEMIKIVNKSIDSKLDKSENLLGSSDEIMAYEEDMAKQKLNKDAVVDAVDKAVEKEKAKAILLNKRKDRIQDYKKYSIHTRSKEFEILDEKFSKKRQFYNKKQSASKSLEKMQKNLKDSKNDILSIIDDIIYDK